MLKACRTPGPTACSKTLATEDVFEKLVKSLFNTNLNVFSDECSIRLGSHNYYGTSDCSVRVS